MTRQQKRKMERNSKKKQTKNIGVVSITMVDTKSIIDGENQFFFLDDMNLNKKKKLMQTIVLTNFGDETHINFGLLCIIHEYTTDFNSESLIKSTFEKIINISSDLNNQTILNDIQKITVIDNLTFELTIDSTKSRSEIIKNKMFETAKELINFNKKVLEAA